MHVQWEEGKEKSRTRKNMQAGSGSEDLSPLPKVI